MTIFEKKVYKAVSRIPLIGISLMPSAFAAQVFLPFIYIHGKKSQCAAKGKGTSNILASYLR